MRDYRTIELAMDRISLKLDPVIEELRALLATIPEEPYRKCLIQEDRKIIYRVIEHLGSQKRSLQRRDD